MNYFLVDYENVNVSGLDGIANLTENDTVIIFYSEKADTLTFGMHRRIIKSTATFKFQKVLLKEKNALDFQLCSYLGFLIKDTATEENLDNKYFIVSNDKGYSILPDYWKKFGFNLKVISNLSKSEINPPQLMNVSNTPKTEQNETPQPVNVSNAPKVEQNETPQPANNLNVIETESNKISADKNTTSETAEIINNPEIIKLITVSKTKTEVNNALCKKFGSQKGGEIYRAIKHLLTNDETPQPENNSSALENELNKILSNKNDVPAVAEIMNNFTITKDVHNNLVKKFGSQKGVEIYRKIKHLLANNENPQPANSSNALENELNKFLKDKNTVSELAKMINLSKAKTEVNNILCKKFGSQKGGEVYRAIKSLINDKK